jgi:excisionase family DNA binding protein
VETELEITGSNREGDIYSAAQAARVLGVSRRHVLNLLRDGELEGFREAEGSPWNSSSGPSTPCGTGDRTRAGRQRPLGARLRRRNTEIGRSLARELGRLEGRLELTEMARSTLEEQAARERERADRLEEELRQERSKGFWRRLLGG